MGLSDKFALFDYHGMLVDTEELQRLAYNAAFDMFGLQLPNGAPVEWDDNYNEMFGDVVGDGRDKLHFYFNDVIKMWPASTMAFMPSPRTKADQDQLVYLLEKAQNEQYQYMLEHVQEPSPAMLEASGSSGAIAVAPAATTMEMEATTVVVDAMVEDAVTVVESFVDDASAVMDSMVEEAVAAVESMVSAPAVTVTTAAVETIVEDALDTVTAVPITTMAASQEFAPTIADAASDFVDAAVASEPDAEIDTAVEAAEEAVDAVMDLAAVTTAEEVAPKKKSPPGGFFKAPSWNPEKAFAAFIKRHFTV